MRSLLRVAGGIDRISAFFGRVAAWLVLLACLVSAGNAVSRYLFSLSSNAWLEIQWQMFSGIFLLGAADVLRLNEHVRVDLFYGSAPRRRKLWIDLLGIPLFLVPSVLVIGFFSIEFFMTSFMSREHSPNAGGLLLWPVKLLLPVGLFLLLLQGIAEWIKRLAALRGGNDEVVDYERPLQ